MNLYLTPSLQQMALNKIAIVLWSRKDLSAKILQYSSSKEFWKIIEKVCNVETCNVNEDPTCEWQEIETCVINSVCALPLPEKLKKMLFPVIEPVGMQIKSWMSFHLNNKCVTKFPALLFWKSSGIIDDKKTAEVLVKDESLDISCRLMLAYVYCMENDIRDLSEKCSLNKFYEDSLIKLWRNYLNQNNKFSFQDNFEQCENAFTLSAKRGNEVAIRYFCLKLGLQNTKKLRIQTAMVLARMSNSDIENKFNHTERISDVLYFLLSTMNAEQQTEILKRHTYGVLRFFLSLPWQDLFLEMLRSNWHFLSTDAYGCLALTIARKVSKHNNFDELFLEFRLQTHESWQRYIAVNMNLGEILRELCATNDRMNIKKILSELRTSPREIGNEDHIITYLNMFDFEKTEYKLCDIYKLIELCFYNDFRN